MAEMSDEAGFTVPMIITSKQISGRLTASTNRSLYRTNDYGDSWEEIAVN
jgi:hypothetical protein